MQRLPSIVFLEDSPYDLELIQRVLRKNGIDFIGDALQSMEQFKERLRASTPDIIISDYKLPGFTGLEALLEVKKSGKDIPFILVSGTLPDEEAVKAVRLGAKDYVLKDKLQRLAPAVIREFDALLQRQEKEKSDNILS
ncbi:MAG: response regulator, partial [Bacteroidota bacterium]